ncbi:MAG: alpha/beta fold hydrolase [Pseudomonadota bacterium]
MAISSEPTPLVLLPGMMCDHRLWRAQAAALSVHREVITPALHGGDTIASIAANLLTKFPPRFSLAGLSMGGIVAFEIIRQAPGRVGRLALLDTNHRADTPEKRRVRDRQMADVKAGALEMVMRDELKPNYLATIHRSNLALLDEVLSMGLDLGEGVFQAQSQALKTRPDSSSTLRTISVPTVVICGSEDAVCPPLLHREISAAIPGSVLHVIEDCGHLSPLEQPDRVTSLLQHWLGIVPDSVPGPQQNHKENAPCN